MSKENKQLLTLNNALYLEPIDFKYNLSWSLIEQARNRPPLGWREQFCKWDKILFKISEDLEDEQYYPPKGEEFTAFHWTPLSKVKVVIVGQDPYFDVGRIGRPKAMGASFSLPDGEPPSPSLLNIYKEIQNCYKDFKIPNHGNLMYWAAQGVLLLNKDLTVTPGKAKSHKGWWASFLNEIILELRKTRPKTIFLLWGADARELEDDITAKKRILTAAHPSPTNVRGGFIGCEHFKKVNEMLKTDGETEIDWQI